MLLAKSKATKLKVQLKVKELQTSSVLWLYLVYLLGRTMCSHLLTFDKTFDKGDCFQMTFMYIQHVPYVLALGHSADLNIKILKNFISQA